MYGAPQHPPRLEAQSVCSVTFRNQHHQQSLTHLWSTFLCSCIHPSCCIHHGACGGVRRVRASNPFPLVSRQLADHLFLVALRLQAAATGPKDGDYQVADISLADFGRKEIELAEVRGHGVFC